MGLNISSKINWSEERKQLTEYKERKKSHAFNDCFVVIMNTSFKHASF